MAAPPRASAPCPVQASVTAAIQSCPEFGLATAAMAAQAHLPKDDVLESRVGLTSPCQALTQMIASELESVVVSDSGNEGGSVARSC
jgi:hypothetical protein